MFVVMILGYGLAILFTVIGVVGYYVNFQRIKNGATTPDIGENILYALGFLVVAFLISIITYMVLN